MLKFKKLICRIFGHRWYWYIKADMKLGMYREQYCSRCWKSRNKKYVQTGSDEQYEKDKRMENVLAAGRVQ
jgi:hypothetical protein